MKAERRNPKAEDPQLSTFNPQLPQASLRVFGFAPDVGPLQGQSAGTRPATRRKGFYNPA